MAKKLAPTIIHPLKEALSDIFWYKRDLRTFLTHSISNPGILSKLNWDDYKRTIASNLIDYLAANQSIYLNDLLGLIEEIMKISNFSHLERLDNGKELARKAKLSIASLKEAVGNNANIFTDKKLAEERRTKAAERLAESGDFRKKLEEYNQNYLSFIMTVDHQKRGYQLEGLLRDIFELFDMDPKASFRTVGEQIDGAFTFEFTDYLLEAKWVNRQINASDLDSLSGKITRRLDNTLGLYLSINSFSDDAVALYKQSKSFIILMDGMDLMAVLDGRIPLNELLRRKRRAAAESGNVFLRINEIMCGG
ncbi:MAG: hypothetical protein V1797_14880 [Pseudomonadota bacterium]